MASGYVDFNTNRTWATVRVRYSYDSTRFYVDDVEVSLTQWITYNRVTDGYIRVNGTTIDSGGLQFIPTTSGFYSLGISGSVPLTSTVTISFHAKNYSGWFAVTDHADYQFMINNGTTATINTSGSSSGDSGGGSWEEAGKNTLHISEGIGTKITVQRTWTDYYGGVGVLQDGADVWYPADRFQITAEALPGYKIDYYTSDDGERLPFIMDNLTKPYAGEPYQLSRNSDVTVSTTATRSTNIRIDDGSTFDNKYWCYIDTEHVVYPADGLYCSVIGQRTCRGYSNVSLENDYDTESSGCWGSYTPGGGGKMYFSYHMKFKTPEYIDHPANLTISIKMKGMDLGFSGAADPDPTMRYAICSSDANYQLYARTTSPVTDEFQIISGTFAENTTNGGVSNIVVKNVILDPDTIYYLIIWDANYMMSGRQTNIYPASEHNIAVELAGSDPIYYTKFDLYIPYIDNGTSWDLL